MFDFLVPLFLYSITALCLLIILILCFLLWLAYHDHLRQQQVIEGYREANAALWQELAVRFSHEKANEWIDALQREMFGEDVL